MWRSPTSAMVPWKRVLFTNHSTSRANYASQRSSSSRTTSSQVTCHMSLRQPSDSTARFADANAIRYAVVDGNDVGAVSDAAGELINLARNGEGAWIHRGRDVPLVRTCRLARGHRRWREPRAGRLGELASERSTSAPSCCLVNQGSWTAEEARAPEAVVSEEVERAWDIAIQDPYPPSEALLDRVYFKSSGEQATHA